MSGLISIIFTLTISFSSLVFSPSALAATGINNGQLAPCPNSPNCVVSQGADEDHGIAPLTYQSDRATAKENLLKVLSVVPRTTVIEQTDDYIRSESKSRIFKFVDDVEFYLPQDEQVIHVRSASRVGESDLGVNRRRIEQIRLALQDLTRNQ